MKNNKSDNPYLLMLAVLLLWGSFAAVSKLVLNQVDSFQVQFYIMGFALLVMTLILAVNGSVAELRNISVKEYGKLVLFSLPSFLYYFLYLIALKLIPAVEASMLNYLFPIMIVVFAVPINKEKLDTGKVISIILGCIGMLIVLSNGNITGIRLSNIYGDLLAIAAAISWGIFSNLGKRNRIDVFLSNYVFTLVQFVLSTVCMLCFSSFVIPDLPSIAGLAWLGISNIVLAYYLWIKALKVASSALIASLSFMTPFATLLFIRLLLGERISACQVFGLMVIVLGIAVQSLPAVIHHHVKMQ